MMSWWDSLIFGLWARFGSILGEILFVICVVLVIFVIIRCGLWWQDRKAEKVWKRRNVPTSGDDPGPGRS